MKYILTPAKTAWEKLFVILVGFLLILIWNYSALSFIGWLNTYQISIPFLPPPPKYELFFACILAPIWEELAYRYAPIQISKKFNHELLIPILIISSAMFGWGHGRAGESILIQGVTGLIFAFVYIKNNYSLLSSMFLHGFWNFFILVIIPFINK